MATTRNCSDCNIKMRNEQCPTEICSQHFICNTCGADIHSGTRLDEIDYVTALEEYKTSYAIIQAELASYDIDNTTTNNGAN